MTLREAIAKFKERCENNVKIQEIKEKLVAEAKAKQIEKNSDKRVEEEKIVKE